MAQVVARDHCDRLGEGPLWSARDGVIYWTDILERRVNRLTLATGAVDSWVLPEMVGWVIERAGGGLVAGLQSGPHLLTLDPLEVTPLADLPDHPADNRMNDAKADQHGRLWAGTMPLRGDQLAGALYRIDPDRRVTLMDASYKIANGPAIHPDGASLFHTDSGKGRVYRFPLHDDGSLGSRTLFVQFDREMGSPDGMTFDADGGLWIAQWGASRISRFDAQGRVERSIDLPASQITSMAFAGEALDRLFVTSAADGVEEQAGGALFEVDPGCRGLAPYRYGG